MPKKKKKKDIYLRTLLNSLNAFLSVGKTTDETDRAVSIGLNVSKYTCVYLRVSVIILLLTVLPINTRDELPYYRLNRLL